MKDHHPDQLIQIFNDLFIPHYQTRLDYSKDEPIYLPADQHNPHHRVLFAHGFFASALHEISHWCIAGAERRKLIDFGYWYQPDGRNAQQQRAFELVEIKPQAIEWILSKACGSQFNISTDNLNGNPEEIAAGREQFAHNVYRQVKNYLENGLPACAEVLKRALLDYYQGHQHLTVEDFALSEIISVSS